MVRPRTQPTVCTVPGCGKPTNARGLCNAHYSAWRESQPRPACTVAGCEQKQSAKGLCREHYDLARKSGDPLDRWRRRRGTGHVRARGYIAYATKGRKVEFEHIRVWEAANGPVPKGWEVHHVNLDARDNRLENLQALSKSDHAKLHYALKKDKMHRRYPSQAL